MQGWAALAPYHSESELGGGGGSRGGCLITAPRYPLRLPYLGAQVRTLAGAPEKREASGSSVSFQARGWGWACPVRGNCLGPYAPPASKGSRSGGVSSRQHHREPFEKGVRKPSRDQGQAGAAFVWQEMSGVTSGPPGLGPASSCTPHPPRQDRGLRAAPAPGLPAFVSGAFRRGRLSRGVPCPLEGAGGGHGRGTPL